MRRLATIAIMLMAVTLPTGQGLGRAVGSEPGGHATSRGQQGRVPQCRPSGQQPLGLVPLVMGREVLQAMAREEHNQLVVLHSRKGGLNRSN